LSGGAAQERGAPAGPAAPPRTTIQATTKQKGDVAEQAALAFLQAQGLRLLARNQRTPGRGGGELDLVMQAPDGTVVFVEVRARRAAGHGDAAASITAAKQRRIVLAARHFLQAWTGEPPACRFDVVLVDGEGDARRMRWVQAAFDADA
jgi:putative endonuclease